MRTSAHGAHLRQPRVAVIGAGFGGIGAALALAEAGLRDVTIFDSAGRVGGTWQANTYPGAACDAPSHIYSYSFARQREWTRRFAPGPEIRDYLASCAAEHGLADRFEAATTVTAAHWTGRDWELTTSRGSRRFDVLVCATGQLNVPAYPALPGLADFAGPVVHTAEWPSDLDLAGRRVAVVGTGASAIQVVPAIVDRVAALTVFQRSAPYVFPKPDAAYSARLHRLWRLAPALRAAAGAAWWASFELFTLAFWKWPRAMWPLEAAHAALLARTVTDETVRRALTPDYRAGCKRILIGSGYHECFNRTHVRLETAPIVGVDAGGVRTAADHHDADVLVLATGFDTGTFASTLDVRGRDGLTLRQAWAGGASAHLGISVPGFPNFFLVYGPNTNLGSGSIVYMLETQAAHIADAVSRLADAPQQCAIEVDPAAHRRYADWLDRRLTGRTVWTTGCANWYRDGRGRDTHNWPGFMSTYRRRARRLNPADYRLIPLPRPATATGDTRIRHA